MNRRSRSPVRLALSLASLGASLAASGCFEYVPVATDAVPTGVDVRVYMSRRGMADLPEDLPTGGSFVTGRWMRAGGDSVLLQVPVVRRLEEPGAPDIRQNLFVARGEVVDVRLRRFSGARTVLAVGGAAGLGTAIVLVVMQAAGSDEPDPGEGPDQIRVPLLSIHAP